MEATNPQGSATTVSQAANAFMGMLDPQQPEEGQVEEQAAAPEDEVLEDAPEEVEASEEVQEEVEEKPRYRVKVDNEELEVDLDELIKGYSRTSDYTKKTQTLAEQRKAVEAERVRIEEAARLRDTYAERLQVIEQMLTAQPEEDLTAMKDNDPIGYAVKVAEKLERDKQLAAIRAERESVAQKQQAERAQQLQSHLAKESERLVAAIPELATEKGDTVRKEIKEFAKSIGFSDQELSAVYDHRAVLTLYKAMQYDKLQKGKPGVVKKVADAPKALKPGVSTPKSAEADVTKKLMGQLRKTGKKGDAARLFERFL